jgi:hypothetical protein
MPIHDPRVPDELLAVSRSLIEIVAKTPAARERRRVRELLEKVAPKPKETSQILDVVDVIKFLFEHEARRIVDPKTEPKNDRLVTTAAVAQQPRENLCRGPFRYHWPDDAIIMPNETRTPLPADYALVIRALFTRAGEKFRIRKSFVSMEELVTIALAAEVRKKPGPKKVRKASSQICKQIRGMDDKTKRKAGHQFVRVFNDWLRTRGIDSKSIWLFDRTVKVYKLGEGWAKQGSPLRNFATAFSIPTHPDDVVGLAHEQQFPSGKTHTTEAGESDS